MQSDEIIIMHNNPAFAIGALTQKDIRWRHFLDVYCDKKNALLVNALLEIVTKKKDGHEKDLITPPHKAYKLLIKKLYDGRARPTSAKEAYPLPASVIRESFIDLIPTLFEAKIIKKDKDITMKNAIAIIRKGAKILGMKSRALNSSVAVY